MMRRLRTKILVGAGALGIAFAGVAYAWFQPGRMTGGGKFDCTSLNGGDVTHGFELHCFEPGEPLDVPNNLELNWHDNGEKHFKLSALDTNDENTICFMDPTLHPGPTPPAACFNTYRGKGSGDLNGVPGATIFFEFTDVGEGSTDHDTAKVRILDAGGTEVLNCDTAQLEFGNHQAHLENDSRVCTVVH
jgi:hypothetical protein